MGAPELWRIVVSLVGSGMVVGALFFALRMLKWDLSRLPQQWVAPIITCVMMFCSVALLLTLVDRGPRRAAAGAIESGIDRAQTLPGWSFKVYQLENWGELARRMSLGQEISRYMLSELQDSGLDARRGLDNELPIDLYGGGGPRPTDLIKHFAGMAPFKCISGTVSRRKDGRYEAHVQLHAIDRQARSTLLLEHTVSFRGSDDSTLEAADEVVQRLVAFVREETDKLSE